MSSKTDLVNVPQGEYLGLSNVVVVSIPAQQLSIKEVTADARKLLGVVAIELTFVFVVSAGLFFTKTEGTCTFVNNHQWISLIALGGWTVTLVIYKFRVSRRSEGSGPLPPLCLENVLIFVLTTLCLTVIYVFMTLCPDGGEIMIQVLGCTLVAVLTPRNTTACCGQCLGAMTFVLGLVEFLMILTSEFFPVSIDLQYRIFLIIGILDLAFSQFYMFYYLETIAGGKMDKNDGWFNACLMVFWTLRTFVMLLLLCGLCGLLQDLQVSQAEKS